MERLINKVAELGAAAVVAFNTAHSPVVEVPTSLKQDHPNHQVTYLNKSLNLTLYGLCASNDAFDDREKINDFIRESGATTGGIGTFGRYSTLAIVDPDFTQEILDLQWGPGFRWSIGFAGTLGAPNDSSGEYPIRAFTFAFPDEITDLSNLEEIRQNMEIIESVEGTLQCPPVEPSPSTPQESTIISIP